MAENVTYREAFQRFDQLLASVEKEGRSFVIHDGERPLGALVPVEAPLALGALVPVEAPLIMVASPSALALAPGPEP